MSANCGPSFCGETATPLQREFFDRAASFASSPTPSTGDGASWSAVIRPRKLRTCYCTTPRARNEAWWRRQVARGRARTRGDAHVTPTATRMIRDVYAYALTLPEDLRDRASLDAVGTAVDELRQRMGDEAERFLDPSRDAGVSDPSTMELSERLRRLRKKARKHPLARARSAQEASDRAFEKLARYDEEATELKRLIRTTELSKFREELERRVKVLRRLGHVNDEHVVQLKGRAACEIDTADELLVTELMFNGCFGRLDHHQLVALCSCFMPVEKSKEGHLGEEVGAALAAPMRELENTARLVGEEQRACGLAVDVDDFVDSFKPTLAEVVYAWSKGAHFDDVMKKTDLFEGTVIRCHAATRRAHDGAAPRGVRGGGRNTRRKIRRGSGGAFDTASSSPRRSTSDEPGHAPATDRVDALRREK